MKKIGCRSTAAIRTDLLFTAGSVIALMCGPAAASELDGLGDLPGGVEFSNARAVNADGSVVVGQSGSNNGEEAALWTASEGLVGLGDLPGGVYFSSATAVSDVGSVVAGWSFSSGGIEAFRWEAGVMTGLGFLPGGRESLAWGVSGDGAVIVGSSGSALGLQAFRWTQGAGMVGLGALGGTNDSQAFGVNADGSVIVGQSRNASGETEAFRWTETGGMSGLGILPAYASSSANAVSSNGLVAVGVNVHPNGSTQAFRWTQETGHVGLGFLPNDTSSFAQAVNADGSVVVGYGQAASGPGHAFYWTEQAGMRSLAEMLESDGVSLGAWQLWNANGVSADGLVVVGRGVNPDGVGEAFWVRLDHDVAGILSPSVLAQSLPTMSVVFSAAAGAANLDGVMDVAWSIEPAPATGGNRSLMMNSAAREGDLAGAQRAGDVRVWALGGARTYSGDVTAAESYDGTWGASYQVTPALRVGGGVRHTSLEGDLPTYGGEASIDANAVVGFAAYEPQDSGLRVYVGILAGASQSEISRGYLNGVDVVASSGERDGEAFGGSVILGWNFEPGEAAAVTPFVRYDATHLRLDGYEETGGPFPARFDKVEDTVEVWRTGVRESAALNDHLLFDGSVTWAHRMSDRLPDIAGAILPVTDFSFTGAGVEQDWAEASIGLRWTVRDGVAVRISAGASSDGDTAPELSGAIGVDMRL